MSMSAAVTRRTPPRLDGLKGILEIVLVVAIFFPMAINAAVSQYLVFPALLFVYALVVALRAQRVIAALILTAYGLVLVVVFALIWFGPTPDLLGVVSVGLVLWPLGIFSFTANSTRAASLARIRKAWLFCAFASVPLAVCEYLTGSRIFPARLLTNLDRSVAGTEHPIVLGMMLSAAIPLLLGLRRSARMAGVAVLLVGVFTTGSAGPMAVSVILSVVVLLARKDRTEQRGVIWIGIAAVGLFAYLAYSATNVWSTQLHDATINDYNDQYRLAIYSMVPRMLSDAPFGFGLAGLPPGQYYVQSTLLGLMDVSKTLDSEFVLLVAKIGVLGIAVAVAAVYFAVRSLGRNRMIALVFLAFLMNSFTVALHAWPGVAIATGYLFGACAWLVKRKRPASKPRRRPGGDRRLRARSPEWRDAQSMAQMADPSEFSTHIAT